MKSLQLYGSDELHSYSEFHALQAQIKEVYKLQHNLETQVQALHNPLKKAVVRAKKWISGKQEPTIKQNLQLKLALIQKLRTALEQRTEDARTSLDKIISFTEEQEQTLTKGLKEKETYGKELTTYHEKLKTYTPKKERSFEEDKALKSTLREAEECKHHYLLTLDKIGDLHQQRHYLTSKEEFIRDRVHQSEKLTEKTKRFEAHLELLCDTYDTLFHQNKLATSLLHFLGLGKAYLGHADLYLGELQKRESEIAQTDYVRNLFTFEQERHKETERIKALEQLVKNYKLT